jgi:murein DD-endopeptidase MepM/ murein hydrolase activator NlpD
MAGTTQQDPNTVQNPDDTDYDRRFNDIQKAEEDGTFNDIVKNYDNDGNSGDNSSTTTNRDEEDPGRPGYTGKGSYYNNFTGAEKQKLQSINGVHFLRRKGPLAIILTIFLGGGIGFSALFSPSILIVQMRQVMVDKFNTQLATADVRSSKMISAKLDNTTKGVCSSVITIRCRYSSISEKLKINLEAEGIVVVGEKVKGLNRYQPVSYVFTDPITRTVTDIPAGDFNKEIAKNRNLATAFAGAHNAKSSGFITASRPWKWVASKLGLSKAATFDGTEKDSADRQKKLQDVTKNGAVVTSASGIVCDGNGDNCVDENKKPVTKEAAAAASDLANEIAQGADDVAETGVKVGLGALDAAANTVKVTGWVDDACTVYNSIRLLGFAAKTVRAIQLARYAMAFMNMSDQILDGSAKAEDVAYFGGILTEIAYDASSSAKKTIGSATDSPGYKFVAFGDRPKLSNFSSQFLAGGGLTGDLIGLTETIKNTIPGDEAATCGVLSNPFVSIGSAAVGLVLFLVPGVNIAMTAKTIGQGVTAIALQVAAMALPNMLKDIVAGVVTDKYTVGALAGEAYTVGAGVSLGTLANAAGNAALTPEQAVAFSSEQAAVQTKYAKLEADSLSPFDTSNKNTFLGSIVSTLLPYQSKTSSVTGTLSSVGSVIQSSFASIFTPVVKAVDSTTVTDYQQCDDGEYKALNLATDPYCNLIFGIPSEYLNGDPIAALDALGDANVDPITGNPVAGSDYDNFAKSCIERSTPYGQDDGGLNNGAGCIINDSNKNYYIVWADHQINAAMDREYDEETTTTTPVAGSATLPLDKGFRINATGDYKDPGYTGKNKPHKGIDLGFAGGSNKKPVYAVMAGTVVTSAKGSTTCTHPGGNTNTVNIRHTDGTITGYLHMRGTDITVSVGDVVTAGQQIGLTSDCGARLGAYHLHFESSVGTNKESWITSLSNVVRSGQTYVSPVDYMKHYGVTMP